MAACPRGWDSTGEIVPPIDTRDCDSRRYYVVRFDIAEAWYATDGAFGLIRRAARHQRQDAFAHGSHLDAVAGRSLRRGEVSATQAFPPGIAS
jgi:cold shock CspA family protein